MTLIQEYRKLINKHFAAVQTDTALEYTDSYSTEKRAKQFWNDFRELETAFVARLEKINEQ